MLSDCYVLNLGPIHIPYTQRFIRLTLVMSLTLLIMTCIALLQGTQSLSFGAFWQWLLSPSNLSDPNTTDLIQLRFPRIVVAIIGGAMLALSGYLLQVSSGNPLADAGLLGISQGTSAIILIGSVLFQLPPTWLPFIGLIGGLLTGMFVLGLSRYISAKNGLVLIGLAVSITLSSIIEIVMVSGNITQYTRYVTWSHGSLSAISQSDMFRLSLWAVALTMPLFFVSRVVNPLQLGSEQAAALGSNPAKSRILLTLYAVVLVAPVISITGPIAFIGLMASHIARRLVRGSPWEQLVITMLCGSLSLLLADIMGRILFLPLVIPAGLLLSLTGIIGFLIIARVTRKT
ncbi:iron ABC transporter permease [Vibrio mimicus]